MATQSAELIDLYSYKPYVNSTYNTDLIKSLQVIKDPYSGKFYGSGSLDTVLADIEDAVSFYSNPTNAPQKAPIYSSGTSPTFQEESKAALNTLSSITLTGDNYVQKPQMVESFNAHPEGWNKYFESAYKSPRLAEDNATAARQNSQSIQGGNATGNQLVSSNLAIRKEVGTGVGKESVGLNPFGKLDAGLNI